MAVTHGPRDGAGARAARDAVLDWLEASEKQGSREVYFEVRRDSVRVRWRVEGSLRSARPRPGDEERALLGSLRSAREGGTVGNGHYHVERLLKKDGYVLLVKVLDRAIPKVDVTDARVRTIEYLLAHPWGLVVYAGPRASGKTRWLLESLGAYFLTPENNVISAVMPPDFDFAGVNQIDPRSWRNVRDARRLRQITGLFDVLLLGSLGRGDLPAIAVEQALGRLVLGTMESDDAVMAIQDLAHMADSSGFSLYDLSRALHAVVSVRLLRRTCESCKTFHRYSVLELRSAGIPEEVAERPDFHRGTGCRECQNTGYRGLVSISEVLEFDDPLREAIAKGASGHELRAHALRMGMLTLHQGALQALRSTQTTPEEIARHRLWVAKA
jgi:type IV pilus assembly protein PilB